MVFRTDGFSNFTDAMQGGKFGIIRWRREGIGTDSVKADAPLLYLCFQVTKGLLDAPVVFFLRRFKVATLLMSPSQIILGVV